MILIRIAGCQHEGVIVLLVMNQGFNGAVVVSHLINSQDLTPNFAGSCYGIMNTIGMTTGMFVPVISGALNIKYVMIVE
jgi:ACS family sodium-dependent inorganic phosphate cotransporter